MLYFLAQTHTHVTIYVFYISLNNDVSVTATSSFIRWCLPSSSMLALIQEALQVCADWVDQSEPGAGQHRHLPSLRIQTHLKAFSASLHMSATVFSRTILVTPTNQATENNADRV